MLFVQNRLRGVFGSCDMARRGMEGQFLNSADTPHVFRLTLTRSPLDRRTSLMSLPFEGSPYCSFRTDCEGCLVAAIWQGVGWRCNFLTPLRPLSWFA